MNEDRQVLKILRRTLQEIIQITIVKRGVNLNDVVILCPIDLVLIKKYDVIVGKDTKEDKHKYEKG